MSIQYLKSCTISEQQYISCLMNFPTLLEGEEENYCSNTISIVLFDTLKKIQEAGLDFDVHTITSYAIKVNAEVTNDLIRSLKESVEITEKDFAHYKKKVTEAYVKDKVQSGILKKVSTNLLSKNELDLGGIEDTIKDLQWALDTVKNKNAKLLNTTDLSNLYEEELNNRGKSGNVLSSGDSWLDKHLYGGGLLKGQYAVVYGLSGVGKSIYALRCTNGLLNKRIPCLYIPNEMGKISTMDRLVAQRLEIPVDELNEINQESGGVSDYVKEGFKQERKRLERTKNFHLVDESGLCIRDIKDLIKDCKRINKSDDLVVIIDLFTMLKDFKGEGKANISEDAVNTYFDVLKGENVASMIVVQARRADKTTVESVADIEKFRPSTEMLKNSGAFEERARQVISIFRAKHYINKFIPDDPEGMLVEDIMEVSIQKQNMGQLATLKYLYNGEIGKIWKYEEPEE